MLRPSLLFAACAACAFQEPLRAQCFGWTDTFGSPLAGADRPVQALATLDLGAGPALYAGGNFLQVGPTAAVGVARWDGAAWSQVGAGLPGTVVALASLDAGQGEVLYAGGYLLGGGPLARFEGGSWTLVGGLAGTQALGVTALLCFDDDGLGDDLYVGGTFDSAGGLPSGCIARFAGASWSSVGGGMTASGFAAVLALCAFDDGSGEALYATGVFTRAGGVPASSIARWDGTAWSDIGGIDGDARALAVFDDGTGPALYVGGRYDHAGGVEVRNLARYDGGAWSGVGFAAPSEFPYVDALIVFDDGTGPGLYATGSFVHAGGQTANSIARYDAGGWSALQQGLSGTGMALATFDDGSGDALHVGGQIGKAGPVDLAALARWDGGQWSDVGEPAGLGLVPSLAPLNALAAFDAGAGERLYAGGGFAVAQSATRGLARFEGDRWEGVGFDPAGTVEALLVHDDGSGAALFAGGRFDVGGALHVARFDGVGFAPLGLGVAGGTTRVDALATFDDGGGPALYVAGEFTQAGGGPASRVARWDGAQWSALGAGLDLRAHALCVFDDGGGPALFAGGAFTQAGGNPASRVARWDGVGWTPLGGGLGGLGISRCETLAVFDDGGGAALYVGGRFGSAGGVLTKGVARWDGAGWSAPGGGMQGFLNQVEVEVLFVFDDGAGAALYAGGHALGAPSDELQRFDGVSWEGLGDVQMSTEQVTVNALAAFDVGNGTALLAGGTFTKVDGRSAWSLAERARSEGPTCPNGTGLPFCFGDGSGSACPCANAGAEGHGCASSSVAAGGRLTGSGDPASGAVALHASDLPGSATAVLIRSASASTPRGGVPFGDGLLCVGAPVVRLAVASASAGQIDWPLQHHVGAGTYRYQAWYRNDAPAFCTPERFNLSNAFAIVFP